MGIEFRDGSYLRRVAMGKRTIKEGEAAVIWSRNGRCREVIGPSLERMFYCTIRFLTQHVARPGEYIKIHTKSGVVEHIVGPAAVFMNPVKHISVEVQSGYNLATPQDCLVVCTRRAQSVLDDVRKADATPAPGRDDYLDRRVVRGPVQFVPKVNETVMTLRWTKRSQTLGDHSEPKLENLTNFDTRPFRIDVETGLTTADGHTYTIRLNIGARITDVDTAIDCADPIGAMWQALRADLARIGSMCDRESGDPGLLGDMQLTALRTAAGSAGINILDIQVQGIERPSKLQNDINTAKEAAVAHANAIKEANRAAELDRLTAETKLRRAKQEEEVAIAEHHAAKLTEEHQHELATVKQEHTLLLQEIANKAGTEAERTRNAVLLDFLGQLRTYDVDLTQYLKSMGGQDPAMDPRQQVAAAAGLDPTTMYRISAVTTTGSKAPC